MQKTFQRLSHRGPRAAREYPCLRRAVDSGSLAVSSLNIVSPIFCFRYRIMTLAAAIVRRFKPATGGDDTAVWKRRAIIDQFFQIPRAVADDAGSRLPKAGADFLWRGGNDVVEALVDRRPVAQANENLGALAGRKRGREIRGTLQIDPFDQA